MSDGSASPVKADSATGGGATPKPTNEVTFTEKEERVLKVAWQCLKSGPPDVDIAKLQELAGFNTSKTTSNTWGVIKKKLMSMAPASTTEGGNAGEDINGGAGATPKPVTKATPKKRTKKAADSSADGADDDEASATPAKKARTPKETPAKSGVKAKAGPDADGAGDAAEAEGGKSPVKSASPVKKASSKATPKKTQVAAAKEAKVKAAKADTEEEGEEEVKVRNEEADADAEAAKKEGEAMDTEG